MFNKMENSNTVYITKKKHENKKLIVNVDIELLTDLSKLDKDKTYLVGVDMLNQDTPDDIKYGLEAVLRAFRSKGYDNVMVYSTSQFKIKEPIEGTKEDLVPIRENKYE